MTADLLRHQAVCKRIGEAISDLIADGELEMAETMIRGWRKQLDAGKIDEVEKDLAELFGDD
jgi:hypothetical protein